MSAPLPDPAFEWEVTPAQLRDLLASDSPPELIDCREVNEHEFCRISPCHLLPLSQMAHAPPQVDPPECGVVIYCHHGVRSLHAAQILRAGKDVPIFSLAGGIDRWSIEIDPEVPRY